ncbi:rCG58775, partial [Rattus norvegicus]
MSKRYKRSNGFFD